MVARQKPALALVDPLESTLLEEIARLPEPYLECRTLGHAWRLTFLGPIHKADTAVHDKARNSSYDPDGARVTRCTRCKTTRIEFFMYRFGSQMPYLLTRAYICPERYHVTGSQGSRVHMHDELFKRHWEGE